MLYILIIQYKYYFFNHKMKTIVLIYLLHNNLDFGKGVYKKEESGEPKSSAYVFLVVLGNVVVVFGCVCKFGIV